MPGYDRFFAPTEEKKGTADRKTLTQLSCPRQTRKTLDDSQEKVEQVQIR